MKDGVWKQITIRQVFANSGYGTVTTYKTFCIAWAKTQIGAGKEFWAAQRINTDIAGLAELTQYIRGVDETMQIVIDGIVYDITSVVGERENNKMELKFKRVA